MRFITEGTAPYNSTIYVSWTVTGVNIDKVDQVLLSKGF